VDQRFTVEQRSRHGGRLRVLTIGAVGLRKGSPYVLQAARLLQGRAVFRMVGSTRVSETALRELRTQVEVVGTVPRSEIVRHYAWADVFLLPSVCEGSATVTYEALACGLPVICTPNAGSIVRDGVDGFLVPARDTGAMVTRLELLASSPALWQSLSHNARERAVFGSTMAYGERLLRALSGQEAAHDLHV
jgi:glycosyltransferase involved in cell wall biosynthesis